MSSLSPRQLFLLDLACKPICEAFDSPPYLVGTAQDPRSDGRQPRDVDVRLILDDKRWKRLDRAVAMGGLAFLGVAIGQYLADLTGLPIDFQIQQQTAANEHHAGKQRNPLGGRQLCDFQGDAPVGSPPSLKAKK